MHVVATDLLMANSYPYQDANSTAEDWAPIFFSKHYIDEHHDVTPENYELKSEELERLGILVSKLRARIRDDAEAEVKMEFDLGTMPKVDFDKAIQKIRSRKATRDIKTGPAYCMDFKEPVPSTSRHRSSKRAPLTVNEKINIVHQVLVGKEMQAMVAREYRVSAKVVSILCCAVKKQP